MIFLELVVISRLQKINPSFGHAIHKAIFLGESPRPTTSKFILQGLWLADPSKWIAQNALYDFKRAQRYSALGLDPVA